MKIQAVLLISVFLISSCNDLNNGDKDFSPVYELIERALPGESANFEFEVFHPEGCEYSAFEISSLPEGKILIKSTDILSASRGFYYYLRYYLHGNISRAGSQIPEFEKLPSLESPFFKESAMPYRYYLNYCSFSYSMAFWSWEDWEKEIDWMALQGINMPLAITGSEAVWQNTLRRLNYSEEEILDFIPGPAYTAWWLMDNLEGWGGPVSQNWIDTRMLLQKKILQRMRELGMKPVLPGFYGMVPNSTIEKFPRNNIYKDKQWGGLQRPAFIDPRDTLFTRMARLYYEEQEKLYGKAEFYSGDPFHEGGDKMVDLKECAEIIQGEMLRHSPGSTWILQGWQENPADELLAGTIKANTLVLDLSGEGQPHYEKRQSFQDRNFLWCNINNFGNNTYMFAKFDSIVNVPVKLSGHKYSNNFKGIGMLMEGIFTDPVVYDLFYDIAWEEKKTDIDEWLKDYSVYRYGKECLSIEEAMKILGHTVYNAGHRTENLMCARPSLDAVRTTTWAPAAPPPYSQDSLLLALRLYMNVENPYITATKTYRFDLANIARQAMSRKSYEKLMELKAFNETKDINAFRKSASEFLDLILVTDSLVSQMDNFSFYHWQESALRLASDEKEKELFLWNANRILSLWSNEIGSEYLHDYSYREWYGLLSNFYYPRWKMYFDYLLSTMSGETPLEAPDFYEWENDWCNKRFEEPVMDGIDIKKMVESFIFDGK